MNAQADDKRSARDAGNWISRWTTLADIERSLIDEPQQGLRAWARTTAGIVAMLLTVQIVTGLLLAFYYVPSTESAHTTVSYIEKVLPAGSWLRSLHHYGSQWLTLALVLHLLQMFWNATYRRRPVGWIASIALLAIALSSGATGYSLPWDARAFFGTRVAEGIAGGLPLLGSAARKWLLGGTDISPVTLARFYALHALLLPALILLVVVARLFVFRERGTVSAEEERKLEAWMHGQLARNAVAAGLVFLALALYASRTFAPLGPPVDTAAPGYLPRPGAQFLWLFQLLKYLPGRFASPVALFLPGLIFIGLAALPFLKRAPLERVMAHPRRNIGFALFALSILLFTVLTVIAYVEDSRDTRVSAQLARQSFEEAAFRATPFTPQRLRASESVIDETETTTQTEQRQISTPNASQSPDPNGATSPSPETQKTISATPPDSYITKCSGCHGTRGQGVKIYPRLIGISSKPQRTVEDLIAIINNPASYGLDPLMPGFANKLTEEEKRQIAEWIASLKKRK
jgi:ubiquinol-cytochrome c reductase cytochrome b subunit